ncbi:uncharacterized protein LOC135465863 [Liolophura sinensis]|uniref:uncharacterized protein LOC135465863 n=1 Tax=Liolophura sinensis TaxID=3198878 RepID=UPI0031597187
MTGKAKCPVKDCGEEIKQQDFERVIENTREYGNLSDVGETLLRAASDYIHRETNYVWKNAKVAVLGPDLQLVFVSGYQSYQIVVTLDNNASVNEFCEEKGWKRMNRPNNDVTRITVWGDIRGTLTDRLLSVLITMIRDSQQVVTSDTIKKTNATGLRSRYVPNGTGKVANDMDRNGDVVKDHGHSEKWTSGGRFIRRSCKCLALSVFAGLAVTLSLTAAMVFVYGV